MRSALARASSSRSRFDASSDTQSRRRDARFSSADADSAPDSTDRAGNVADSLRTFATSWRSARNSEKRRVAVAVRVPS